jgi:hypothetical protein
MPVNKKELARGLAGLPSVDQMLSPENFDRVPAVVRSQDGSKETPAALTEGEYVFSVPAILALGEGDYNKGADLLEHVHSLLREKSKGYIDKAGLEAAGLGES